jgi:hypothetical protein
MSNKKHHVMIDIETAAKCNKALVLSVGVVSFYPYENKIIKSSQTRMELAEQILMGRETSQETCDWWLEQDPRAIKSAWFEGINRSTVESLYEELASFFSTGEEIVWANGVDFDLSILESLFDDFNFKTPWKYSLKRCMRTLKEVKGVEEIDRQGLHHDSLDDAEHQARQVMKFLQHINKDFI